MAIIRTAKGLQQASDETLKDRMQRLDLPQTTSATSAAAFGATPKQQDMAGTQARKQAVIQENLAPKQEQLPLSQRYAQQQSELTGAQGAQLDEAQKLAKLAGLDTRIQKLAEERINQAGAQPVQRKADVTELSKTIPQSDARYAQAAAALQDYANDPSKQEQALVTLQNLGIAPAQINNLLETTDVALGRSADISQLRGSDLDADLRNMGYAGGILELNQQLGKDLGSLSIEDLTKEIQSYRQKVTSEKERLEAAALGQTGMQQQAAMTQLQAFTQAGGVGQEQAVEKALAPIDMATTIKVGDQDMRVDDMLKDQEFSDLMEQWALSSPEEREKLIPSAQFGGLTQWLTQNEQALKQAASSAEGAQQQFATTQAGVQALGKDVLQDRAALSALVPGFDTKKAYTQAELGQLQQSLQSSPAYQFAQSGDVGRTYINSFKPEELSQLQGMDTPQLEKQAATYNKVKGSPQVQTRYDLDPTTKVYDQSQLNAIDSFTKLPTYLQDLGSDADFKSLTIDQLKYFDKNGATDQEMEKEFREFLSEQKAGMASNETTLMNDVFGGTADALNTKRAELQARADYGDADAMAALQEMNQLDVNRDGKLDVADARQLSTARSQELAGKDAEYFKQQYGTGAKGFETLSEKTGALGKKIATGAGQGAFADVGIQEAMKTGNFKPVTDMYQDSKSYNNIAQLIDQYKKSGLPLGDKYNKLLSAQIKMIESYTDSVKAEAAPFLSADVPPSEFAKYLQMAKKYENTDDPRNKTALQFIDNYKKDYAGLRRRKELPSFSGETVAYGTGPGYDALMNYWGSKSLGKKEAQAFKTFMTSKMSTDPTYTPNFADSTKRKELEDYMKSVGFTQYGMKPF